MKLIIVSIHDRAVDAYQPPFAVRSPGEAIRGFMDAVNDPKTGFHQHADDYNIFKVGEFDDTNGQLTTCEPEKLGDGKQLKMNSITLRG